MGVLDAAFRAFRAVARAYEWARGRRHYTWSTSPPQRLFAMVAHRLHGWPGAHYRAVYGVAGGALKFRERLHAERRNFGYTISGAVDARVLTHAALWQYAMIAASHGARFHVNVHVRGDGAGLDRFNALLLVSDAIGSVRYFFDDVTALDSRSHALTLAEEQHGWGMDEGSRADDYALDAALFDGAAWRQIFSQATGFDRNVNHYLKLAHAGARVVAVSLPEDAAGLADAALPAWGKALARYAAANHDVHFVLLNRFGPAAMQSISPALRGGIAFASQGGLSFAEALFLAQKADAYVGVVDVFGLAARAASRAGVYVLQEGHAFGDEAKGIVHTANATPEAVLAKLGRVLDAGAAHGAPALDPAPAALAEPQAPPQALYTLVIPTYNRPALLQRLLEYLARQQWKFPVLVLDSSGPEALAKNREAASLAPHVRHVTFDSSTDPYAKMRDGMAMVETPYCSLCADDDLVVPAAIERCVRALERDPQAAVAHGYYFNFKETSVFELSYVVYRGPSIEDETPLARLRRLFAKYEAVIYGVYRTPVARRMFRDVQTLDTVLARELITGAITALAGKCLRLPAFYYGRNTDESMSYSEWHPHQILAQQPERLFTTYPAYRERVLEALHEFDPQAPEPASGHVVDLIMLRYLDAPPEILDFIVDLKLQGKQPEQIVRRVWDVFVRHERAPRPLVPLLRESGAYSPDVLGVGRARDYAHESHGPRGTKREYRVLFEFLYPDLAPPAAADKIDLIALLGVLDTY